MPWILKKYFVLPTNAVIQVPYAVLSILDYSSICSFNNEKCKSNVKCSYKMSTTLQWHSWKIPGSTLQRSSSEQIVGKKSIIKIVLRVDLLHIFENKTKDLLYNPQFLTILTVKSWKNKSFGEWKIYLCLQVRFLYKRESYLRRFTNKCKMTSYWSVIFFATKFY